jgi:hypothetical protein
VLAGSTGTTQFEAFWFQLFNLRNFKDDFSTVEPKFESILVTGKIKGNKKLRNSISEASAISEFTAISVASAAV